MAATLIAAPTHELHPYRRRRAARLSTPRTSPPHVLRHTAAMTLLHAGVDTTVIALWLGHESVEGTTRIYLDADLSIKERALARTKPTIKQPLGLLPSRPDRLLAFLAGRPGALLRPAPLRTGRAAFTASGSSKPRGIVGVQKCRPLLWAPWGWRWQRAWMSRGSLRPTCRRSHGDRDDRLAGGPQPVFPLAWALWLVGDVQELASAERAAIVLGCRGAAGWSCRSAGAASFDVAWPSTRSGRGHPGTPALDHLVSDDAGPGELVQIGAALAVAEHPPVLSGLVELAEVLGDHPGPRLVRVAEGRPTCR